jgi:phage tail-like protein
MESSIVYGSYHFKLSIDGIDSDLLFNTFSPPQLSLDGVHFYTWDANGNPIPSTGGGKQPIPGEWSIGRARDDKHALYDWFKKIHDEGAATNKKDCTVAAMSPDGSTTLHTWNLKGTIITGYSHSAANAQSQEILVETANLKSEDVSLEF